MRDFDEEMERLRKQGDLMRRITLAWVAMAALFILTVLGGAVYTFMTVTPEDVGAFFGRIVSGFEGAR